VLSGLLLPEDIWSAADWFEGRSPGKIAALLSVIREAVDDGVEVLRRLAPPPIAARRGGEFAPPVTERKFEGW